MPSPPKQPTFLFSCPCFNEQIDFGNVLFILLVENVTIVEDVAPKILHHTGDC